MTKQEFVNLQRMRLQVIRKKLASFKAERESKQYQEMKTEYEKHDSHMCAMTVAHDNRYQQNLEEVIAHLEAKFECN